MINKGDYVLATKYHDGNGKDQWCVGFFFEEKDGRYYVVDGNGSQFRSNGFGRCEKINQEIGDYILQHGQEIESAAVRLWGLVRKIKRGVIKTNGA